jgi:penicillin-binding protein 2
MDMVDAVVQSCDVYFYDLSYRLGVQQMHDFMAWFGFGRRAGVDIFGELGGLLPSPEWKRRTRNMPWYPGETLIMGIGQGYFLSTPLELATATATLASGGVRYRPHVVRALKGADGVERTSGYEQAVFQVPISSQKNWDDMIHSMVEVIEHSRGTGRRIQSENYTIAGKTGTAQVFTVGQDEEYNEEEVAEKMRDHALFIAFAPAESPRIAVAVIVENGGHGGAVAAPIAGRMMDRYLVGD